MIAFAARRLLAAFGVIVAVTVVTFLIFFATPGVDPARQMAGPKATPETIDLIRRDYALDRPLWVQYGQLVDHLFIARDLTSYSNRGVKVVPEIARAAPVSLALVGGAAVLWLVLSIALGMASFRLRGRAVDSALFVGSLIGLALPAFWLASVSLIITEDVLGDVFPFSVLPPPGYTPLTEDPVQWAGGLLIPWCVVAALYVGLYARVLRGSLIESSGQEFVKMARAKGLRERDVRNRHVLRTALIPYVSLFGLDVAVLAGGGALVIEVVFGLPGVGLLTYNALRTLDLPVILATVAYTAGFVVLANAAVDIVYARLDPRIRIKGSA